MKQLWLRMTIGFTRCQESDRRLFKPRLSVSKTTFCLLPELNCFIFKGQTEFSQFLLIFLKIKVDKIPIQNHFVQWIKAALASPSIVSSWPHEPLFTHYITHILRDLNLTLFGKHLNGTHTHTYAHMCTSVV